MTDAGHRRAQYALILVGLLAVAAAVAWAKNTVDGLYVEGDVHASGKVQVGTTVTVGTDLTVNGDADFNGDLAVATDHSLTADFVTLIPQTGEFPDPGTMAAGTLASRGDTLYIVNTGRAGWEAIGP